MTQAIAQVTAQASGTSPEVPGVNVTALLLRLLGEARRVPSQDALAFLIADDTRSLIGYRRLTLLVPGSVARLGDRPRVRAVSGVSILDRSAPFVPWVEAAAAAIRESKPGEGAHLVRVSDLPERLRPDWRDMGAPVVWWIPFPDLGAGRDALVGGGLWLDRDAPPTQAEIVLMESLVEAYAHAWLALERPGRLGGSRGRGGGRRLARSLARPLTLGAVVLALAALFLPVPQSALVPARVAARDPLVITATLDGVVAEVPVAPNQRVEVGDLLVRYDDTALKGRHAVAERVVDVARAELRQAEQRAFGEREGAADVALLRARLAKSEAELALVAEQLARVVVRAERAGVVILEDPDQWVGRPVGTGERILDVADPDKVRMEADLPVDAALVTRSGAPLRLFLDGDPLTPLSGKLESVGYRPRITDRGIAAYKVVGGLDAEEDGTVPRIGLTGTARISGEKVPLALYLFRRPIAVLRQRLGF
jgi:multidrug resistance efflux pump